MILNQELALTHFNIDTDQGSAEHVNGVENSASLTHIMAHFYPEEMMGDMGGFGLDPNLIGNAW